MTDVFDLAAITVDGALGYSLSVLEVLTRDDMGNHRGSLHPRAAYDLNESKFEEVCTSLLCPPLLRTLLCTPCRAQMGFG